MLQINDKNIKRWSLLGQRPTFGLCLTDLAKNDFDIIVLTADVSTSAGLERYRKLYPDQYIDVGIAEQNMMGIATGLASEGYKIVTTTFAPFQTMRCLEQIRVNLGYMQEKVCLVGLAGGLYHGYLGNTHCSIEDLGVIRCIPNMIVATPADGMETVKCIEAALCAEQSVYIRLSGGSEQKIVYSEDYEFKFGKANVLKEGADIAIIANGLMVAEAMAAAVILEQMNISCMVVDMHTIKPIDIELLDSISDSFQYLLTIEEHSCIGGLGSAVAEYYANKNIRPIHEIIGISDMYPHESEYEIMKETYGLNTKKITEKVLKILEVR